MSRSQDRLGDEDLVTIIRQDKEEQHHSIFFPFGASVEPLEDEDKNDFLADMEFSFSPLPIHGQVNLMGCGVSLGGTFQDPSLLSQEPIREISRETDEVTKMLEKNVFNNDPYLAEFDDVTPETFKLSSLDPELIQILTDLFGVDQLDLAEFDQLCTKYDQFSDAVIEIFNDWSYERYGHSLIEISDKYLLVDTELLKDIQNDNN